jgi:extracellular factor (EF) 3-hydroxypalmitic acid methyl ester biosynthesis protein
MSGANKSIEVTPIVSVREKRFEILKNANLITQIDGVSCQVQNISDTGLAFFSELKYETNQSAVFVLKLSDSQVLELKGHIIWSRQEGEMALYGFHFNNQYIPEGFLAAFEHISFFKREIQNELRNYEIINPEFKALSFEIKNYLSLIKTKLDNLENQLMVQSQARKNSYREVISSNFENEFVDRLKSYSRKLDKIFSPIADKELRKIHVNFFQKEVASFYIGNPFIGRALKKPQGYAGDFEMMNQIYRDSLEGQTFFEMLMHRYGINESSSLSVKYRQGYFCNKLMMLADGRDSVTIASMASGPAREVVEFLSKVSPEVSSKYRIFLIDQDIDALLNAKRNCFEQILRRNLKCEMHFLAISVKEIIEQQSTVNPLNGVTMDFLYTAGLYDYLTQPVAQMLTQNLLSMVKSGGEMIIGNFHPNNPTKTISELVADWKLIHRNDEEMKNILAFSKYSSFKLHRDTEGIDLFLEIVK